MVSRESRLESKIMYAEELIKTSPKFCNQKVERLLYAILDLTIEMAKILLDRHSAEDDLK